MHNSFSNIRVNYYFLFINLLLKKYSKFSYLKLLVDFMIKWKFTIICMVLFLLNIPCNLILEIAKDLL